MLSKLKFIQIIKLTKNQQSPLIKKKLNFNILNIFKRNLLILKIR